MPQIDPKLTKDQLLQVAKEIGVEIPKSLKTKGQIAGYIEQANPAPELLAEAVGRYKPAKIPKTGSKKSTTAKKKETNDRDFSEFRLEMTHINQKILQLENQIGFLMQKVSALETHLQSPQNPSFLQNGSVTKLKDLILQRTAGGKVISTDELRILPEIQPFPTQLIQQALLDLIDDEYFDVSEGSAKWKLPGNIGLLIRRK
jgi:uncharacterized coiled-coil DUF342 family protein